MNLYASDSTFCETIETEQTGGGVMVDYIKMKNGTIIGITDECVCTHKTYKQIDDGEYEGVIFIGEENIVEDSLPGIYKKILALCEGDKFLCDRAIQKLIGGTTVYHMGEIIDKLKGEGCL